jgi:fructose-1-phosphate kinase PfkB-like protein
MPVADTALWDVWQVIDDNYVCPGFRLGVTQRAVECTSYPVGKGVSCAAVVASLGHADRTAVIVLCGCADTGVYQSELDQKGFRVSGSVWCLGTWVRDFT